MNPTEKHRETAEALIASRIDSMCMTWDHSFGLMDDQQREGLRRNFRQVAYHDLTPFIAAALSKAEREGMKRAAEIARGEAARSTNSVFIPVVANIVAGRILSEANSHSPDTLPVEADSAGEAGSPPSSPASPAPYDPWTVKNGFNPDKVG